MKVEKVLLINCTLDKHSRAKIHNVVSSPNLGLLSIAGVLIMHGYDVKILDFFADPIKKEQYKKILEEFNPDVIGYSVYTRTVPFLRRMVELNKKIGYINYGELIYSGEKKKLLEEFYVIRNVREEIPIGIREKLIGVRKTKDGVQALLKKEYIKEISGLGRIEKATLDDIVVFTSKGE